MKQQPIFFLDIEDLHLEAVLDKGFWYPSSFSPDPHSHNYCELILCTKGQFDVDLADGSQIHMPSGSACLIPPRIFHRTHGNDSAQKLAIRFFGTRNLLRGNVYVTFCAALERLSAPIFLGHQPDLLSLSAQLQRELQQPLLASQACTQSILTQMLVQLIRTVCTPLTPIPEPPLSDNISARRLIIDEYFTAHYHEPITEVLLACELHLSKRQLSRVLQQLYGSSFRQLLIDIRLNHAVQLLATTDLNAEQIAYRVGYTSVSGFYDAFRKRYGISAGKYKDNL